MLEGVCKDAERLLNIMRIIFLFRTNFCHEISFLDFDRLARLDGFRQLSNNREHEQQSHCRKHAAVYHPNGRTKKATDN